jgi:hypothetical protein
MMNDCIDGSVDCFDCCLRAKCQVPTVDLRERMLSLETPNEKEADTQKSVQIQNLLIYYSPFKEPFSNVLSERLGAFFAQLFFGGVSIWNKNLSYTPRAYIIIKSKAKLKIFGGPFPFLFVLYWGMLMNGSIGRALGGCIIPSSISLGKLF